MPDSDIPKESLALLRDLAPLLKTEGPHLTTTRVLEVLEAMPRWRKLQGSKMDRSRVLALILRPLGIKAAQIHWGPLRDGHRRGNTKGYRFEDLAPAIVKYLKG